MMTPNHPTTPLVLLPGTLCDERLFDGQIEALHERAEVTIGSVALDSTIVAMAERVLAAAPDRFAVAGFSLGGIIAIEIGRQAPERLLGVALLDTNHRPVTDTQRSNWKRLADLVDAGRFEEVVTELAPLLSVRAAEPGTARLIREMARAIGPEAFSLQNSAQDTRQDNRSSLRALPPPVLVLCGESDSLCPPAIHEEMAASIPDSKLLIIEGAGHLSPIDRPAEVREAMVAWIDEVTERAQYWRGS